MRPVKKEWCIFDRRLSLQAVVLSFDETTREQCTRYECQSTKATRHDGWQNERQTTIMPSTGRSVVTTLFAEEEREMHAYFAAFFAEARGEDFKALRNKKARALESTYACFTV